MVVCEVLSIRKYLSCTQTLLPFDSVGRSVWFNWLEFARPMVCRRSSRNYEYEYIHVSQLHQDILLQMCSRIRSVGGVDGGVRTSVPKVLYWMVSRGFE
jgi:hypothetical protein